MDSCLNFVQMKLVQDKQSLTKPLLFPFSWVCQTSLFAHYCCCTSELRFERSILKSFPLIELEAITVGFVTRCSSSIAVLVRFFKCQRLLNVFFFVAYKIDFTDLYNYQSDTFSGNFLVILWTRHLGFI